MGMRVSQGASVIIHPSNDYNSLRSVTCRYQSLAATISQGVWCYCLRSYETNHCFTCLRSNYAGTNYIHTSINPLPPIMSAGACQYVVNMSHIIYRTQSTLVFSSCKSHTSTWSSNRNFWWSEKAKHYTPQLGKHATCTHEIAPWCYNYRHINWFRTRGWHNHQLQD